MIELRKSDVTFVEDGHHYYRGDVELGGVTPIVRWMYPGTYDGIPEDVLQRAAQRGTSVHHDCQLADIGIDTGAEAAAYKRLLADNGLTVMHSEWIVDIGHVASAIDKVFDDGSIGDIKATSKIHTEEVTLQLSIYAYMLEKMNDGFVVPRQCVIWLPRAIYGQPQLTWLPRIPSDIIAMAIDDYTQGMLNAASRAAVDAWWRTQHPQRFTDHDIAVIREVEKEIIRIELAVKEAERRNTELRKGMYDLMVNAGVMKYDGERVTFAISKPTERRSVDTKRLKDEMPTVYEKYTKVSKVNGSLTIKIKD